MGSWAGKRERPCSNMDHARSLEQSRRADSFPIARETSTVRSCNIDSLLRPCTVAFTDLLRSELPSANAATPARRRGFGDCWRQWMIEAPGSHQLATAVGTLSVNHELPAEETSPYALEDYLPGWIV